MRSRTSQGDVAQLGERLPCTEEVSGSSPLISTRMQLRSRLIKQDTLERKAIDGMSS